jgi:hypothetical protein
MPILSLVVLIVVIIVVLVENPFPVGLATVRVKDR